MISRFFEAIRLTIKPRDRIALVVGGVMIVSSLLWFMVIEPLDNKVEYLTHRVSKREADLQWMQQAAKKIIRLRENAVAKGEASHAQSLLIVVDNSAKKAGISQAVKRIEPIGEKGVRVWIEEVAFDDLLLWLGDLRLKGIHSDNIAIEHRKVSGHVNTKATLGWQPNDTHS
uniref:Type II secretion system protein M n=1 Tax=Candidatus Kentrum sp. TUN TaxID=2126343 RepID=A0A451A2T7_9GAMM|nr:MAG: general secretion pathway protein M [Candidatus Kentron sp. TUN]VFK62474.1 MAG: general secretion pathway protein M [Candidatus Kentron sp. TUN]VFK71879.1 MAG: general secretion pathway protein M [Candidatus Kentron sp. TUN]